MSIHKSLVSKSALSRHRSVLTRAERVARLADEEKWEEGDTVFGLPKVKVRRVRTGGKSKKAKEATDATDAAQAGAAEAAPVEGTE